MAEQTVVRLESTDNVRLDDLSFMWVVLKRFAIDGSGDQDAILQCLIEHPAYRGALVDYDTRPEDDLDVHGPYPAADITPATYIASNAESARSWLRAWADRETTDEPGDRHPQSQETHDRLEASVLRLLDSGEVLRLAVEQLEMVEWAYAGTIFGFHEFVVIDRDRGTLDLIVAADD